MVIKEPYVRYGAKAMAEIVVPWPKDICEIPLVVPFAKLYHSEVSVDYNCLLVN